MFILLVVLLAYLESYEVIQVLLGIPTEKRCDPRARRQEQDLSTAGAGSASEFQHNLGREAWAKAEAAHRECERTIKRQKHETWKELCDNLDSKDPGHPFRLPKSMDGRSAPPSAAALRSPSGKFIIGNNKTGEARKRNGHCFREHLYVILIKTARGVYPPPRGHWYSQHFLRFLGAGPRNAWRGSTRKAAARSSRSSSTAAPWPT